MNIQGLTEEQQKLEKDFGVIFYLNKNGKLEQKNSIKYEKYLIEKEFQDRIKSITAGYSQAEIDTWNTKVTEAEKVLAGKGSEILESILIKGEPLEKLAINIINKAEEYANIYYQAEKIKREKLKKLEDKNKEQD